MLENFACSFLSSFDVFFQNPFCLKNSFRNSIRASNSLDPDQDRYFVCPDLGPNCLQRLSAIGTNRQRVKYEMNHIIAISA